MDEVQFRELMDVLTRIAVAVENVGTAATTAGKVVATPTEGVETVDGPLGTHPQTVKTA